MTATVDLFGPAGPELRAAGDLRRASGGGGPPIAGVLAGLGLWLGFTMRADLAPPPGR